GSRSTLRSPWQARSRPGGRRMRRRLPVESARSNRRPRRIKATDHAQNTDPRRQRLHRHHLSQRIIASTDWEVYGMDMQSERIADLLPEKRFHFFEGDITINKEWIEYHIKQCDTVLPLVAIATPATYA